ncbi:MAG: hypothetical protein ACJ73J_09090 [Actinomycetes bacterium]
MSADSPPTGDLLAALLSRLLSDRFVPNSAQWPFVPLFTLAETHLDEAELVR